MTRLFSVLLLVLAGAACSRSPKTEGAAKSLPTDPQPPVTRARPPLATVRLGGVPHVRQKPDFCGEAVVAAWSQSRGVPLSQDDVFDASGMDPARGMGVTTRELAAALSALGYAPGKVWHEARAAEPADLDALFTELHADLAQGVPSVVCTRYDERPNTTEHFRLVLGYDAARDVVIYHEPAEDDGSYREMPRTRFLSLWPLRYDRARWTVIRLRLDGTPRLPAPTPTPRPAAVAQHVRALREKLPSGYGVALAPPFVVIGDSPESAARHAKNTVNWAARRLEAQLFQARPGRLLDVWLFPDAESYERSNRQLFGESPGTPYGYYSRRHAALVMNIATGGGTLVHEIVHPYVEADFPGAPAWINEGLGSLYEQSAERDGRIVGLTNWRLAGLQRALRDGGVPSFPAFTAQSDDAFYDDPRGTNYAQARYLMYYLQEHDRLARFYREARDARESDTTGYATLVRVLGESDMAVFQKKWERFVLGLRFRG